MSLPVFAAPSLAGVTTGAVVRLTGEEARHAVVVRRTKVGEQIELTDGAGVLARCTVISAAKSTLGAEVREVRSVPVPSPRLLVVQALAKGDRGERAVEMLTEVGVDLIVPWAAARSVAVWREDRAARSLARWRSTAREAAKQSRRPWFPLVEELASTPDVVDRVRNAALSVVLHEAATVPLASLQVPAEGDIVVVVGPEGGLSDEEVAAFERAGVEPVRLGSSVLRTSTAGVVASAVLLSRTPRWS